MLTATLSAQNQNAKSPPAGIALPEKDKAELLAICVGIHTSLEGQATKIGNKPTEIEMGGEREWVEKWGSG